METKTATTDKETKFVCWTFFGDYGDVSKHFVQLTNNEEGIKTIFDFIKEGKLDDSCLDIADPISEKEAKIVEKFGSDSDKEIFISVVKGKLNLGDSWKKGRLLKINPANIEKFFC
jgi:hypothetical protein